MSALLDRWLTRLYRAVGAALLLAACACLAYTAGDRAWTCRVSSVERPEPTPGTGLGRPPVADDLGTAKTR